MRRTTTMLIAMLVAAAASAQMKVQPQPMVKATPNGAQQPQKVQAGSWETARRIPRDAAIMLVKSGKAVFVDIRSFETYSKGHIKGAISVPRSQLMSRLREIPPGKFVITYCACVREHTAALAVTELEVHGFKNAAALSGGWNEWTAAGLPTATGAN